jgi:hypothetical protein
VKVNQFGQPLVEEYRFAYVGDARAEEQDIADAISLLCEHLKVDIVRTNATKHGGFELQLRRQE